jgi:glycosyltransferase involved in cell wall biosynthesis
MMHPIPRRLIQTGKTLEQPLRNRATMASVRQLNPDFEYLFFDNQQVQDFVDKEFPEYRTVFDSFEFPIERYDFFRYLAVYRLGGFYFDLDVLLAENLSGLLDQGCVFPFEGLTFCHLLRHQYNMDWQIGNYAFGAAAGHPFLGQIIENCVRAHKDPGWIKPMMRGVPSLSRSEFVVFNSTGPGLISRTLAENPDLAASVTVLFPDDVCDVANWNRFGNLGVHLMDGSWRAEMSYWRRRVAQYLEVWTMRRLMKSSRKLGKTRQRFAPVAAEVSNQPLVSILIPAFNAEEWISDTIRSAMGQTWPNKEIIVVDDGSTDQTLALARGFEKHGVKVAVQKNQGAAAARNKAFSLSKGDYIQWLDADDLLHAGKIAEQMTVREGGKSKRTLLAAAWGKFMYRPRQAQFIPTSLWCDLSPVEWLIRKLEQNVYMQTSSWLVSRELTEAAGPWDTRLLGDDDGEYFCRVLLASDGVQFVPDARVYYRTFGYDSLSYIGHSARKCEAQWLSMQLHIQYLRSLEDSPRVRAACMRYLRNGLIYFYPERPDIVGQAEQIAAKLGQTLGPPCLSWKYSWVRTLFGWNIAKNVQISMRKSRWQAQKLLDRTIFRLQNQDPLTSLGIAANSDPLGARKFAVAGASTGSH